MDRAADCLLLNVREMNTVVLNVCQRQSGDGIHMNTTDRSLSNSSNSFNTRGIQEKGSDD